MEENINVFEEASVKKNSLNFGLILGALLILFSLILYILDVFNNRPIESLSFLLMLIVMFLGTKTYRDKYNNGLLSYGKGFTASFMIGLVATLLVAVFTYLFHKFFDPTVGEKIVEIAEEAMLESTPDISDEQLDMAIEYTRKFTTPGWMAVWVVIGNLLASLIISLIVPLFLKKEEVITDTNV